MYPLLIADRGGGYGGGGATEVGVAFQLTAGAHLK